ncbi:MAG: hypothetical protein LBG84_07520 [Treponema sp.]|jgi:uncharacterized integral membrane protein|nr:hypothetical protein [Treponema sp.]
MPWRLLGIILILVVLLGFIGLNLENRSDISLGFTRFSGVPVYLTVFASFVLGMLCSLPFIIALWVKKSGKAPAVPKGKRDPQGLGEAGSGASYGVD